MAKEALELWQALPADTRRMLLSNVWCGECRKAVTIVDYHAELKRIKGTVLFILFRPSPFEPYVTYAEFLFHSRNETIVPKEQLPAYRLADTLVVC